MPRIAILVACSNDSEFARCHPDDGQKFVDLLRPKRPDWNFEIVPIYKDIFPGTAGEFDGYIISGSDESVNGSRQWVRNLLEFIREANAQGVPVFGACFGHQAITKALGGEVSRNGFGWSAGVETTEFVKPNNWLASEGETVRLYSAHTEQVIVPPPGARVVGTNRRAPYAAMSIGDWAFSTQYHPELTPEFMADMIDAMADDLGDSIDESRDQLKHGAEGSDFAALIAEFFEHALSCRETRLGSGSDAIEDRLEFAKDIARQAGELGLRYFRDLGSLKVDSKGVQDLVSEADKEVEKLIRRKILKRFPDDGIIGEEHDPIQGSCGFTWIIDPIDGTANFVKGIPAWTVAIACVQDSEPVIGIIHDPAHDEMFHCRLNGGAYLNDDPIRTARTSGLDEGSLGIGASMKSSRKSIQLLIGSLMDQGGMFVRNGSGALGLAYTAAGRLIGYMEEFMYPWDCVAGILLVEEAGGISFEFSCKEMIEKNGGMVVVASPPVFGSVRDLARLSFSDHCIVPTC